MISVVFVCLGNICRSPMAELIFRKMVKERGLERSFCITSRGTSDEEEGNSIYLPAARTLRAHGVEGEHISAQLSKREVMNADYVLVMDSGNLFDVLRLTGGACSDKVFKLCSFTSRPRDVADPWYTRDFEKAYSDIRDGCEGFLNYVLSAHSDMLGYDLRH